ncbi:MAG: hypothetical protein QM483_00475 [Desulfuromusa sp.]
MKKILFSLILVLLLAIVLLAGVGWFYSEQVLDWIVRPQIVEMAAQSLGAEVQIGHLKRTENGLEIVALRLDSPEQFQIVIPHIQLDFTLTSLWRRQLDTLSITNPQVEIFSSVPSSKGKEGARNFPAKLPLIIKNLVVTDGLVLINDGNRQWRLHGLNFSGELQPQSNFELSLFWGSDRKQPIEIAGQVEFFPRQTVTLTHISWQHQQLVTAPVSVDLNGTEGSPGEGAIHLDQFDHLRLQEILATLGYSSLLPQELLFLLNNSTLHFTLNKPVPQFELQVAQGHFGWDGQNGAFTRLRLLLDHHPDRWQITGQLQGDAGSSLDFSARFDSDNNLSGQARVDIPDPDRFKVAMLGGSPLPISGGLRLTAEYSLKNSQFQLSTDIHCYPMAVAGRKHLLDIGRLSGQGTLAINGNRRTFSLGLRQASHPLLDVSGNFQKIKFSLVSTNLHDIHQLVPGQIPAQLQSATDLKIAGEISRKASGWAGNIRGTAGKIALPQLTLSHFVSSGTFSLSSGQLKMTDASINMALEYGDELTGQASASGVGNFSTHGFSLTLQQLSLTHLNYMAANGQTGVGEAALELQGHIHSVKQDNQVALELAGNFSAEEVLAGEFYADMSPYRGAFSLVGEVNPETAELSADVISIKLPQLGVLMAAGQFSSRKISATGRIKLTDLSESYDDHIGPLLSDINSTLAGLTLEGKVSLNYSLFWNPESWQIHGALNIAGLDGYWEHRGLEIVDGTGSLPFTFKSMGQPAKTASEGESFGSVAFSALSFGPVTMDQGRLELAASPNRMTLLSPLQLHLAGGEVVTDDLSLGITEAGIQGRAKIVISAVDLETLTRELGLPVMQGRLNADLGSLHYADHQLNSDGLISIGVFGGQFQLHNLSCHDPFGNYPLFYTDIDFSDLNLLEATRTFDFGEMNGILDGYIHGLQIFGTIPATFAAAVTTRDRGKRNISVKALNNISIISQGGLSAALSQGVYRFIDFYRYKKIGFQCSLKNDTFTLIGTALPGSEKYLVHGGLLPPKIDITTTTPTISFKEMVNRLSRINRTGN